MQQTAKICQCNPDGTAQVLVVRQSACSGDCHQCSGCGAAKETVTVTARNLIGARAADVVYIESKSGPVLAAAAVLYMLPLLLFFLGYLLGLPDFGPLTGGVGFLLGIAGAVLYDRLVVKKQKTVYTITGYAFPR